MSHEMPANDYGLSPKTRWFNETTTGVMVTESGGGLKITVSDADTFHTMWFGVKDGILVKTRDTGEPL